MDYGKIMSGDEGLWKLVSLTTRIHAGILYTLGGCGISKHMECALWIILL